MTEINNPLKIKEKNLLKVFNKLEELAEINSLDILIEYQPKSREESPILIVTADLGNDNYRMGLAGFGSGRKFMGTVIKPEQISYHEKEGFSEEFIETEAPIFSGIANEVEFFFGMLFVERLKSLVFERNT